MNERVAAIEAILPTLATKADLAELRGDMHEMNANISRWMQATVLTVIGTVVLGFAGLGFTLMSAIKPAPQAQQPTVIVVPQPIAASPQLAPAPAK